MALCLRSIMLLLYPCVTLWYSSKIGNGQKMKRLKRGINLPVMGLVEDKTIKEYTPSLYAMRGVVDVHGLKPTLQVKVGDKIKSGQPIYVNKSNPKVPFVAPVSGKVVHIHRGERRALQSVVIESDGKNTPVKSFPPLA